MKVFPNNRKNRAFNPALVLVAAAIVPLLVVSASMVAMAKFAPSPETTPYPLNKGFEYPGDEPWVVQVFYETDQQLQSLTSRWEPWEIDSLGKSVLIEVYQADLQSLENQGYRVVINTELTTRLHTPAVPLPSQTSGIPGYPCYRTISETYSTGAALANTYPGLAEWVDIGDTWEKITPGGEPGLDIYVLLLTNQEIPGPKPKLFVMSAVHAREYSPAELNTRFGEYLLENYGLDADATWLLDQHEIHLLLQANPDGRLIAENGVSWRKNTDNDDGCTDPDRWGTDLNRNFSFFWGCCNGSSSYTCAETYRGPSPASEPETAAIQDYLRVQYPDQRPDDLVMPAPEDATGIFLDLHSYSELVIWPWGFSIELPPNAPGLQTLGRKLAYFNGYEPSQAIDLYPTDGTTDDFAYGELGLAAYGFEIGTAFFQDCNTFNSQILPDNLEALLYAAKTARTPYLTPAGPDITDIQLDPAVIQTGDPVTVTLLADDTRYNHENGVEPSQPIRSVVYSLDLPFWNSEAQPVELLPADGLFDTSRETASDTISTTLVSTGRHIIYFRAQDDDGNWGAVTAEFLIVADQDSSPPTYLPYIGR